MTTVDAPSASASAAADEPDAQHPPDQASADFDTDTEFETFETAEVYYPFAPVQQWVVLSPDCGEAQLAVLMFVMAHLNPHTGKFDAHFGRRRIAERFGRSLDWVDKQLAGLVKLGALTKTPMFWVDANDHSKGRSTQRLAPDGTKRSQAPNRYRVHLEPPAKADYPGPIKIAEYYRPGEITRRRKTAGQEGAATQRPGSDQANVDNSRGLAEQPTETRGSDQPEPEKPQAKGGPLHSGWGGRPRTAGGAAAQRPKRTRVERTRVERSRGKTTTAAAAEPPDGGSLPPNNSGNSPYRVATKSKLVRNPLHARARNDAGPAACDAIDSNPDITQDELQRIIADGQPNLTQAQVVVRASALRSHESKARREAAAHAI
jgi:hypothetical protein